MRMTSKAVEAVKPTDRRQEIPDSVMRGLYLLVQPSGVRSWAVRYRFNGESRKLTIGTFPAHSLADARDKAAEVIRAVDEGKDPARERQQEQKPDTIKMITEQFMERHCRRNNRPNTIRANEQMIRDYVLPAWAGRNIQDIRKRDCIALLEDIVAKGKKVQANRVAAMLSKIFNWAIEVDIIATSPMMGVRYLTKEKSRERALTDDELAKVWRGAEKLGGAFGAATKVLILTGQRRHEVMRMTWDEVDLDKRVWSLPSERVKNGRAHVVPLSDIAIEILRTMSLSQKDGLVFVGCRSHSRGKRMLDEAVGPIAPWKIHDLRRTFSTGLAKAGVALQVTERILNHKSGSVSGVAAVYNKHSYETEMRAALESWARIILGLVAPRSDSNVVLFRA
jgi:integrase